MTDIGQLRKDAIADAQKAVELDDNGTYEEACKFYIRAAERLGFLAKIDENQFNKETYKKKALEYCERAKYLKDILSGNAEPKQLVTSNGGSK
jgi:hypothetical protein